MLFTPKKLDGREGEKSRMESCGSVKVCNGHAHKITTYVLKSFWGPKSAWRKQTGAAVPSSWTE